MGEFAILGRGNLLSCIEALCNISRYPARPGGRTCKSNKQCSYNRGDASLARYFIHALLHAWGGGGGAEGHGGTEAGGLLLAPPRLGFTSSIAPQNPWQLSHIVQKSKCTCLRVGGRVSVDTGGA